MADVGISSQHLIKSVAKKLKCYIDLKRREEGFDLSGTLEPRLQHPPIKTRNIINAGTTCPRDVKHYFHDPEVRKRLTKFCLCSDKMLRENTIRSELEENMKKYNVREMFLPEGYYKKDKYGNVVPTKNSVPFSMLTYGNSANNKKAFKGGYPTLRSKPTAHVSQGEAERMVNIATKLLACTELNGKDKCELMNRRCKKANIKPKPARRWSYNLHGERIFRDDTAYLAQGCYPNSAKAKQLYRSDDAPIIRGCPVIEKLCETIVSKGAQNEYDVFVRTGNVLGASTHAPVSIIIYGDLGRSDQLELKSANPNWVPFHKGNQEKFRIRHAYVGRVKKIVMSHDGDTDANNWYLESVVVRDFKDGLVYQFPCDQWLAHPNATAEMYPSTAASAKEKSLKSLFLNKPQPPEKRLQESVCCNARTCQRYPDVFIKGLVEQDDEDSLVGICEETAVSRSASSEYADADAPDTAAKGQRKSSYCSTKKTRNSSASNSKAKKPGSASTGGRTSVASTRAASRGPENNSQRPATTKKRVSQLARKPKSKSSTAEEMDDQCNTQLNNHCVVVDFATGGMAAKSGAGDAEANALDQGLVEEFLKAVDVNNVARVEKLFASPQLLYVKDRGSNLNPVQLCARSGYSDTLLFLLSRGADPEVAAGETMKATQLAASAGHIRVLRDLLSLGADVGRPGANGTTALHLAAANGHAEVCQWLMEQRPELETAKNAAGETAKEVATLQGHDHIVRLISDFKSASNTNSAHKSLASTSSSREPSHTSVRARHSVSQDTAGTGPASSTASSARLGSCDGDAASFQAAMERSLSIATLSSSGHAALATASTVSQMME